MNQLYRALHMPPGRLLRKLTGEKEIYTIAVRPLPPAEGTDPLPALGGTPTVPPPNGSRYWRRISTFPFPRCLTGTAIPG